MYQTPVRPLFQGLNRGLAIGELIRRAAHDQEQLALQERRQKQWEEEQARNNQMEDLKLEMLMEERGIRRMTPEDQVNRMTGTRVAVEPGETGGSTGRFKEQPRAWGEKVAPIMADIAAGTMPQTREVKDDNRYVRFRGGEYTLPGESERTQRQIEQDRIKTALELQKKRELATVRTPVDEARIETERARQKNFSSQITTREANQRWKELEPERKAELSKRTMETLLPLIDSVTEDAEVRKALTGSVQSFLANGDIAGAVKVLPNFIEQRQKEEGRVRAGNKLTEFRARNRPPNASWEKQKQGNAADQFVKQAIDDALAGGATTLEHVIANVKKTTNYRDIPSSVRLRALTQLQKMAQEGKQIIGQRTGEDGQPVSVRGTPLVDQGGARPTSAAAKPKALTDQAIAAQYLQKSGGDKNKARELAKADGWDF